MTTIDEYLAWVDQLNDHMDCGCYDTHKALAAEVRRLREVERKFASALPAWKAEEVVWKETEADLLRDLAALRQRHAEAVEIPAAGWHPVRCECEGCGGPKGSKA